MKKFQFFVEFTLIRLFERFFQSFSRHRAFQLGEHLGFALSLLLKKRDQLVINNMRRSFPEKNVKELRVLSNHVWRNLGRTAVEFTRMDEMTSKNYMDYVDFEGEKVVKAASNQGKGIIFVAFHMTNWEYTGYLTSLHFGPVMAVARPMKNPWVDRWVQSKRKAGGTDIILHRNAVKECLRALKLQKYVAILVDQNLYQGGVFVDFFGRPAATTTLPALLNDRTGAPVLIGYSLRDGDRFKNIYIGPLDFPSIDNPKERLLVHTQIINNELEKIIREHPDQWFWVHNRWKRRPDTESPN